MPDALQIADRWHLIENASAAFLDVVRKLIRVDHAIVRSASQASKAADWILGFVEPDGGSVSTVAQQAA